MIIHPDVYDYARRERIAYTQAWRELFARLKSHDDEPRPRATTLEAARAEWNRHLDKCDQCAINHSFAPSPFIPGGINRSYCCFGEAALANLTGLTRRAAVIPDGTPVLYTGWLTQARGRWAIAGRCDVHEPWDPMLDGYDPSFCNRYILTRDDGAKLLHVYSDTITTTVDAEPAWQDEDNNEVYVDPVPATAQTRADP